MLAGLPVYLKSPPVCRQCQSLAHSLIVKRATAQTKHSRVAGIQQGLKLCGLIARRREGHLQKEGVDVHVDLIGRTKLFSSGCTAFKPLPVQVQLTCMHTGAFQNDYRMYSCPAHACQGVPHAFWPRTGADHSRLPCCYTAVRVLQPWQVHTVTHTARLLVVVFEIHVQRL